MNGKVSALTVAFVGLVAACAPTNHSGNKKSKTEQNNTLTPSFPTSAPTRLFLTQLDKELKQSQATLNHYVPSQEITEHYGIIKFNNKYYIQGFITAAAGFNQEALRQLDIELGRPMGNVYTAQIPFYSLAAFFQATGIQYFEIATKSSLK